MSRRHARRYRVAHVPTSNRPWIVQGAGDRRTDWTDVARFHTETEALDYKSRIQTHQFHHLENTPQ
jgi:hypothetical protein